MINYINDLMNSTINNLMNSVSFLLVLFFYTFIVLKMPFDNILHLFGFIALFATGLNAILANEELSK